MKLRAGFIPLVDCAVLVAAARKGFAAHYGVSLELVREASWATMRDKLTIGHIECAHLLAPMVVASQLQIGNPKAHLVTPFSLSMNGNAISLSNALFAAVQETGDLEKDAGPGARARALARVVKDRKVKGEPALTFGMVYPFSAHNYQLRYWLAAGGIDPDMDVNLVVIPPPFVVDYLRGGHIDGFCVGAPWNMIGALEGVSQVFVSGCDIWHMAPEKVLGVREDWAEEEPEVLAAVMRALMDAARFCDNPENRRELAAILSAPDILDMDAQTILQILSGGPGADDLVFHKSAATFPWRSHAHWFYSQMVRWKQAPLCDRMTAQAGQAYRPDIYRAVFEGSDVTLPSANSKVEGALADTGPAGSSTGRLILQRDGFFDHRVFDPDRLDAYIAGFEIAAGPAGAVFED